MKIAGLIVNVFFPGLGSLLCGRILTGLIQFSIYIFVVFCLFLPVIGWLIGLFIGFPNWVWAIVTAVGEVQKESRGSGQTVVSTIVEKVIVCTGCGETTPLGSAFCANCGGSIGKKQGAAAEN